MISNSNQFSGVIVPMVTPFTSGGEIDEKAAARLATRLAEHNIIVFLLGTTGETASIPRSARLKLVTAVVKAVQGQVPVFAGIGDNCFSNAVKASKRYFDAGVSAVVSHLPSYYPLEKQEMLHYFELLHEKVEGPLILYNIPATTGMSLPLSVVEALSTLPRIIGFKDSERDINRIRDAAKRFVSRNDFALYIGSAIYSVEALKLGYDGLVPNSGNLVPGLWEQLLNHAKNGDWREAEALQQQLNEIATVFQKGRSLGQSLSALKALLADQGLCEDHVLPPLQSFPKAARQNLCATLLAHNLS